MLEGTTGAGGVLKLVRDGRATTRNELAQQSGLSRSTLAERVQSLLALDLLEEATGVASTGGRPPATLTFNRSAGVVLVAALNALSVRVAVCDLEANPLAERTFGFDAGAEPAAVLSEYAYGQLRSNACGLLALMSTSATSPAASIATRRCSRGAPPLKFLKDADNAESAPLTVMVLNVGAMRSRSSRYGVPIRSLKSVRRNSSRASPW